MTDSSDAWDDEDLPPSKTAIKREAERLKDIGAQLQALPNDQLAPLNLPERLLAALDEGRRITSREGARRHRQFVGKLLRDMDTAMIEQFLEQRAAAHDSNTRVFHELETLRDQLVSGGNDEIGEVIAAYPGVDTQKLRQLVRNARKEAALSAAPFTQRRALFRFLRGLHLGEE